MIRSLQSLPGLVLAFCVFAVPGCSNAPGAAPATSASPDPNREAPVSVEPAGKRATQPYDQLIYLTEAEVKQRLGEPSEVTTRPKQAALWYKDLEVRVNLMEGMVHRVDVQAGPITEGLSVGDDEALVQKLTTKVKPGSPGISIYDLKRERHWYRISTQDHKVLSAVIEMPALP